MAEAPNEPIPLKRELLRKRTILSFALSVVLNTPSVLAHVLAPVFALDVLQVPLALQVAVFGRTCTRRDQQAGEERECERLHD